MVHREDLIPRFEWLAGSKYYDDALDEALVAIAFTAHGRGWVRTSVLSRVRHAPEESIGDRNPHFQAE